tara:strand:- start:4998 stop:5708 length:711 start_codon:yes stop_codon:yes gene_type:complete
MKNNKIVNLCWPIQNIPFGIVQRLTVASWIEQGFTPHVWSYDNFKYPEVVSRDAREILPESSLFAFKNSYAHWKDLFSFLLIGEKGGWFSDLDIYWLKPPPNPSDYWIANIDLFYGHTPPCQVYLDIASRLEEVFYNKEEAGPYRWGHTRSVFQGALRKNNLKMSQESSNFKSVGPAWSIKWRPEPDWSVIHWCNNSNGKKLNKSGENSFFGQLILKHGIATKKGRGWIVTPNEYD